MTVNQLIRKKCSNIIDYNTIVDFLAGGGRCGSDAAAQLQPTAYACGAQRALLPIAVGAMNINELMNINNACESATIFPRPCKLTF